MDSSSNEADLKFIEQEPITSKSEAGSTSGTGESELESVQSLKIIIETDPTKGIKSHEGRHAISSNDVGHQDVQHD